MSRWLRAAAVALIVAPFGLMLMVAGVFFLWENPWLLKWSWIPFPICWALAYLAIRAGRRRSGSLLWQPEREVALHWTQRDEVAWSKVTARAEQARAIEYPQFFSSELYVKTAHEMAGELAQHYHARTSDPLGGVTVPEVLTAIELAVADLREFVEQHVPASHLVTIQWLQRAPKIPAAWKKFRLAYDAVSLLWNPWGVLYRRAANRTVAQPMVGELERDVMAAVYQAYVLSVGKYLIELNSRRLKVGPDRWRRWMEPQHEKGQDDAAESDEAAQVEPPVELRLAVVGQVKAGKSSLVNALVGRHEAQVDILPSTQRVTRYRLDHHSTPHSLVLLDTPGYATGDTAAFQESAIAARDAAMVILVLHGRQAARQPDAQFLTQLDAWFDEHPERKRPPVLAVVTHIDQLPPAMEWEPPYDDWIEEQPGGVKERNIRDALLAVRESLGDRTDGIVPVCSAGRPLEPYGIDQWLVPALVGLLPRAEGKALIDHLHAELDAGRTRQLMKQLWNASTLLLRHGFTAMPKDATSSEM